MMEWSDRMWNSGDMIKRNYDPKTREFYERAQELEQDGKMHEAAVLYEAANVPYKAIILYEREGEVARAYELAKKSNSFREADRLAYAYGLVGHEFNDFPTDPDCDSNELMAIALSSHLEEGATAERLGFYGFDGKTVVDIGTRDGRFISVFRDLGAKEVYGIDPEVSDLRKAIDAGILDDEHALPIRLQDLPEELREKFDVATILNLNISLSELDDFFRSLREYLPREAQVVITVAEDDYLKQVGKAMFENYFLFKSATIFKHEGNFPHKNLVICKRRPPELEFIVKRSP